MREANAGDEYIFNVSVSALSNIYDPFDRSPWDGVDKIDPDEVVAGAVEKSCRSIAHDDAMQNPLAPPKQAYHVKRIAYLVAHPDPEPIVIVPNVRGSFQLEDGWHRLAAAIYRGDAKIKVAFGGTRRQLKMWLG